MPDINWKTIDVLSFHWFSLFSALWCVTEKSFLDRRILLWTQNFIPSISKNFQHHRGLVRIDFKRVLAYNQHYLRLPQFSVTKDNASSRLVMGAGGWVGIRYSFGCTLNAIPYIVLHIVVHNRRLNMEKTDELFYVHARSGLNRATYPSTKTKSCPQFKPSPASNPSRTSLVEVYSKNVEKTACSTGNCARNPEPTILPTTSQSHIQSLCAP